MGQSTFQGPVRSLNGVYSQGPGTVIPLAAATLTVVYTFFIATTATAIKIRTTSSTPGDLFVGSVITGKDNTLTAGGTATWVPNGSSNDVISLTGTTAGGIAGSYITVVAVDTNKYLVQGVLIGSGTLVTPFADS